jgi:uncharacterized protein (DUF1697 family)
VALVVFLRGVNVGGYRVFRPTTLAKQLRLFDVVNIGATGTLVVRKRVSRTQLRAEIARRLPFEAEIIICDGREILKLHSQDFFAGQPVRRDIIRFVSILSRLPRTMPRLPLHLPSRSDWQLRVLAREGRFVVGLHRRNMKAIGQLGKLDQLLGVPVTTRNCSTIGRIAEVLDGGTT